MLYAEKNYYQAEIVVYCLDCVTCLTSLFLKGLVNMAGFKSKEDQKAEVERKHKATLRRLIEKRKHGQLKQTQLPGIRMPWMEDESNPYDK